MAIFQPAWENIRVGQDATITLTVAGDTTAWTSITAVFRDQVGSDGTAWATKTLAAGEITNTPGVSTSTVVITLLAADTASLAPGPYVWRLEVPVSGADYDAVDWSTIYLTPTDTSDYPQLFNLSDLIAHSRGTLTEAVNDTDVKYYLPKMAAAEATFRRLTGRNLSYGTYTEYFDAPIRGNLWVRETPLRSITSIKFDPTGGYGQLSGTFDSTTLLDSTTDYYFRQDRPDGYGYQGEIFTVKQAGWNWWWPGGYGWGRSYTPGWLGVRPASIPGAFQVIYKAGFKLVPGDVKEALCVMVNQMAQRTPRGTPLQSESGMQYAYQLQSFADEAARLDSVQAVIQGYRRPETLFG